MSFRLPVNSDQSGDDPTLAPSSGDRSLIAADISGAAKRLIVDSSRNLNVNVAASAESGVSTRIDYDGGSSPVYVGETLPGTATSAAGWRIKKIAYDGNGNPVSVLWAASTVGFTQVWDDRASLIYG